jgi:hypothetical protein
MAAIATLAAGGCGDAPQAGAGTGDDRSAAVKPGDRHAPLARERVRRELGRLSRYERPIALLEAATPLRDAPAGDSIQRLVTRTEFDSPKVLAVVGDDRAWLEVIAPELANGQTGWVHARDVDIGGTAYALSASLSDRELTARRRGRVVRRVTIAVGAPATPTPAGTFAVTDKLRMTAAGSPYGCCALALSGHQPDVPQGWSGGDRLAVHATEETETIGAATSLGCLRAGDADMRWLVDAVPLGTPVEIRP